jgi:phage baseplate assembly protein W
MPDVPHFAFPFVRPGVPTRNEVTNPSAEGGTVAPWTANASPSTVVVDTSWSTRGKSSFRVQHTVPAGGAIKYCGISGVNAPIPVTPGQKIAFRFDWKATKALASQISAAWALIRCNKVGGGTVDITSISVMLGNPLVTGQSGTAVSAVGTVPDGVSSAFLIVYSPSSTAGDTFDMSYDAFAISFSGSPAVYGDGNLEGWRWNGTPNASTSTLVRQLPLVEQDSTEHVLGCVEAITCCPVGFRIERPDYGIPWLDYRQTMAPDVIVAALREFEDRAAFAASATRDPVSGDARVTIEMEVESG